MKKILLSACILLSFTLTAAAQQFHWGKMAYSNYTVVTDKAGNSYTVGYVEGNGNSVDVDPGPGVLNVYTSTGSGFRYPYILKYNKHGNIVWMFQVGRATFGLGWQLAVDDSLNVYVAGTYDVAFMDPGTKGFIKKINSSGVQSWEITLGTGYTFDFASCKDMAVDSVGDVYVTGRGDIPDLDPGPGVVPSSGQYIVKYTSAGDYLWHTNAGGLLIEVSRDGNSIYTLGNAIMNNYPALSKRDGSGMQIWSRTFDTVNIRQLNITDEEKIYATGFFRDTLDFDPGPGVTELASAGGSDQFLLKMDTSGAFIWAKQLGSTAADQGTGVVLDDEGHIYTCGEFAGTVDMDPGAGVNNLVSTTPDTTDIFVQKLDTAGNYIWAVPIASTGIDRSYGMAIDTAGAIIMIGDGYGVDVDPDTATNIINAYSFITKWSDTTVITTSANTVLNSEDRILIYPNPSGKTITVSASLAIDNIIVTDITGRTVQNITPSGKRASFDINTPGVYFLNITTGGRTLREKVVIQ